MEWQSGRKVQKVGESTSWNWAGSGVLVRVCLCSGLDLPKVVGETLHLGYFWKML